MYSNVYTCTRAHPYRTSSRVKARVSDKSADKSARIVVCPARGKLNGEVAGHTDILATILARKSARMSVSVSVSVSVPWNSSLYTLADFYESALSVSVVALMSARRHKGSNVHTIGTFPA